MLKPYVGVVVHYIPMSDMELRCESCDQPRAAIITRVHNDLDVDLNVFTSKVAGCVRVRTSVPYALKSDKAPHWRWMDTSGLETVQDPEVVPIQVKGPATPLQDALRALMVGRGIRDRLLLERWAKALEGHLVDTSVVFDVGKDGKIHVGVTTEEGTVLEEEPGVLNKTPEMSEEEWRRRMPQPHHPNDRAGSSSGLKKGHGYSMDPLPQLSDTTLAGGPDDEVHVEFDDVETTPQGEQA